MPVVAVLPVKSFRLGKWRLSPDLDPEARFLLGRAMAERTAELAATAGMLPLVVAGDEAVAEWAIRSGLPAVPDPGSGLDEAARIGVVWAGEADTDWLVLHCDLPLLTGSDLDEVTALVTSGASVIAPSADGGTSAIGGHGEAHFSYGPASFHTHLARFPEAVVVARLGFLHDVDSMSDLESARSHPRGRWLAGL